MLKDGKYYIHIFHEKLIKLDSGEDISSQVTPGFFILIAQELCCVDPDGDIISVKDGKYYHFGRKKGEIK